MLRPNGVGDETALSGQYPPSGEHWDKVDDITPDEWTTWVFARGDAWLRDFYTLPACPGAKIRKLVAYARCSHTSKDIAQPNVKIAIKTHGSDYEGDEETSPFSVFKTFSWEWVDNPATGRSWTPAEVNALQVGVAMREPERGSETCCTRVYVEVCWLPGRGLDALVDDREGLRARFLPTLDSVPRRD